VEAACNGEIGSVKAQGCWISGTTKSSIRTAGPKLAGERWRSALMSPGGNSISYGLSMVGGVNGSNRPNLNTIKDSQVATLEKQMRELSAEFPDFKWCGHRDLSPDKNGNGVSEPFEHIKACPCFDAIPWARERGLPVADSKGTLKTIVLESSSARCSKAPIRARLTCSGV
jgi:hypothetical protein